MCICLTEEETQAVDRHIRHSGDGSEADVLTKLSMQSQQVRAEMYRSLQYMRLQRAQLQSSLRQQRETDSNNDQNGVCVLKMIPVTLNTMSGQ